MNIDLYVPIDYRGVSDEFCHYFYNSYDLNFYRLLTIFNENTRITFAGKELIGSRSFINHIEQLHITSFQHFEVNMTSQPLNDRLLLIQTDGFMSVNYDPFVRPFVETIVIDGVSGYVINYIFRL